MGTGRSYDGEAPRDSDESWSDEGSPGLSPDAVVATPRIQEQLLIGWAGDLPSATLLSNTVGRAQFAHHYATSHPERVVRCFFWDLYQHQQAQLAYAQQPPRWELACGADVPLGQVELGAFFTDQGGEAELTRETLQAFHDRLSLGGLLVATTNNPRDRWLEREMRALFPRVQRREAAEGIGYWATKTAPLRKLKSFDCELVFRDGQRLLQLKTRPGVFAHRRIDAGARRLIEAMEIRPEMQVLDLGCGSGAVAIAAATRAADVRVWAVDSNARAVQCVEWARQRNEISNLHVSLDADGRTVPTQAFDLVVANPPYYSNHRIAEHFVRTAHRALVPTGRLLLVTKRLPWYEAFLPQCFGRVEAWEQKGYLVIAADEPF